MRKGRKESKRGDVCVKKPQAILYRKEELPFHFPLLVLLVGEGDWKTLPYGMVQLLPDASISCPPSVTTRCLF